MTTAHRGASEAAADGSRTRRVLVAGAGPAGLTAAYVLAGRGLACTVVEADTVVGGLSRTVERDGFRFDLGGHRFYTKVPEVAALWAEMLPAEDFPLRPRLSRIYYRGKFFDYPLRPVNALRNLGPLESALCLGSYLRARLRPPADPGSFEGWVSGRFGWRLYRTFFKTYTEKVWGVPADEIAADWAAQRIRDLSLGRALLESIPGRRRGGVTSLIEEFRYPVLGPGMMWENVARLLEGTGSELLLGTRLERVHREAGRAVAVTLGRRGACVAEESWRVEIGELISSIPLGELVLALDPPAPPEVCLAAKSLLHRDFLTVALVVPENRGFRDNWIYVHDPGVRLGRVQNFGSWSPALVRDGLTCLGLEYFTFEGDEMWSAADDDLVALGTSELARIGLLDPDDVSAAYVVRVPQAYPVYDPGYAERVDVLRRFLAEELPNVQAVGRNGMHRYNNQDHSMLTAMLAVENLFGAGHDLWSVNVDEEYLEEAARDDAGAGTGAGHGRGGSGRDAPVVPARSG